MKLKMHAAAIAIALAVPTASASAASPVKVTRFHLGMPIDPAPVVVLAGADADPKSLEQQQLNDAVAAQLAGIGFPREAGDSTAPLVATVSLKRTARDETSPNKPVTIGLGGGSYGSGVGGGLGIGFGIGKRPTRSFYDTELFVQIRRRSDGTALWEGRAQMTANVKSKEAQPEAAVNKLAAALFRGFPGESGRTITVK